MTSLKSKFLQLVQKYKLIMFVIIVTICSLYVRYKFYSYISVDFSWSLDNWIKTIRANGGVNSLKLNIGDYNEPYIIILTFLSYLPISSLKIVKCLSVFFDYAGACSATLLVWGLLKDKAYRKTAAVITYTIILFLPTVIINSSLWGQCDMIYTTFILLSLYFLIEERYIPSFVLLGIAFSFKLQFIFILPLYVILYFKKEKISILHFGLIFLANLIMCMPAIIFGKSLKSIIKIYVNQASEYPDLACNFPSIYTLFPNNPIFSSYGVIVLAMVFGVALIVFLERDIIFNKEMIITLGLWSIVMSVFLLPHMHERYMFVADVLSVIWYIAYRKKIYITVGINLISLLSYIPYLFRITVVDFKILTIGLLIVVVLLTMHTFNLDNKKLNYLMESENHNS
ncbi:hypothetical protein JHL18_05180 [Clostridium sp. YIM B02505]|uniref:Mannosyltransferase related to Gpi18 n=1 Tax=Clostridium yunnanense TaxID=2800325 RepID=A0ABS1EKY9_9CLOT|nr:hypothetical protein [Clostridium yunnanense]MBK1810036.1 hypothetical protein [Clostridium yunnanense]